MRKTIEIDVAVIGAGTAGLGARSAAKRAGKSALMIDPGPFGTTCARVGCMPSKLLIAAANAAHHARHADLFGVSTTVKIDGKKVLSRVQSERDRFVGFVNQSIDSAKAQDELVVGRAKVVSPGVLHVDEHTEIRFQSLVVAAGSSPFVPPPFRGLDDRLLSNEGIFELTELPESLLVIGLGVIGLELGQAFHRLGVRTTLLGVGGGIGPISDPDILAEAHQVFTRELDLHSDYKLENIQRSEEGVEVSFVDSKGKERKETFQRILMAAGRRHNFASLGLEAYELHGNDRGQYQVDPDTLQMGDAPVFAAGDVNGLHPLLHEAADDGRIAGENAAPYPRIRKAHRRTPLGVVFSDPQIATIGQGFSQLNKCDAVVGEVDYGDQGRARVDGINQGKARIYAERRTGKLIGAELFGPKAEHLSHLLAWAVQSGLRVDDALDMPFYHPVLEEGIRTALRDAQRQLVRDEPIDCIIAAHGVGG